MRAVIAIIFINLACVYSWNGPVLPRTSDFGWMDGRAMAQNITLLPMWQPYDHFNSSVKSRFKTWYYQDVDSFQPGGPIYILLWSSSFHRRDLPIERNWTMISELAEETKGAMFLYQLRYFGESKPAPSKDASYYKYFNISQSLADIAEFIKHLKSKPDFQSSKVVVMGYSREGNLATWMRLVYPNLVDAAVAATAPLLAKKNADEYLEYTAYLYDTYGSKNCVNHIEERFQFFEDALKNTSAMETYKHKHQICEENNFTAIEDQQQYMLFLYMGYYEYAYEANIEGIANCEYWQINIPGCWDFRYYHMIEFLKKNLITHLANDYRICAEFGAFMTTSGKKRPLDHLVPLDFHLTFCKEVFEIDEKRLDEGIAQTNLIYGGITPNVTNVVFTNGEFCPERLLAVQQNISDAAPAFLVKKSGSPNILFKRLHEPQDIIEIRNRVKSLIKRWIGL